MFGMHVKRLNLSKKILDSNNKESPVSDGNFGREELNKTYSRGHRIGQMKHRRSGCQPTFVNLERRLFSLLFFKAIRPLEVNFVTT